VDVATRTTATRSFGSFRYCIPPVAMVHHHSTNLSGAGPTLAFVPKSSLCGHNFVSYMFPSFVDWYLSFPILTWPLIETRS
jgi:hypothetical protein